MSYLIVINPGGALVLLLLSLLSLCLSTAAANAKVPDFTKGEVLDPNHRKKKIQDRTMGPTGLWDQDILVRYFAVESH